MNDIVAWCVSALAPGIVVGIVLGVWERRKKREEEHSKIQAAMQVECEMIRIDLLVATAQLSYAVAMAYKRGHANGEMESAIEAYEGAMTKFRKFERKQMAINTRE